MTVTSGIVQQVSAACQTGILAQGPITVAAGAIYSSPKLQTNGYKYAQLSPGGGGVAIYQASIYLMGQQIWANNAGSYVPSGGFISVNAPVAHATVRVGRTRAA